MRDVPPSTKSLLIGIRIGGIIGPIQACYKKGEHPKFTVRVGFRGIGAYRECTEAPNGGGVLEAEKMQLDEVRRVQMRLGFRA